MGDYFYFGIVTIEQLFILFSESGLKLALNDAFSSLPNDADGTDDVDDKMVDFDAQIVIN